MTLATPNLEDPVYEPSPKGQTPHTTPQGALTLMSKSGKPFGFLNAEEITAFRTALVSSLLVSRRGKVKTLTVFGSGKQAYWHIRLCLLLRGSTIKHVNIINRTFSNRARDLLKSFFGIGQAVKQKEGWFNTKFGMLTPAYGEFPRMQKEQIRGADVIICTTPSTDPLFEHTILTNTEGRKKGRLIIAVGSYKPHMIELPTEILDQAVKHHGSGHHFHKHAEEGGVIVCDTLTAASKEAGEIVQAKIHPSHLVEIGELVMLEHMDPLESAIDDDDESPHESMRSLQLDGSSTSSGSSRSMGAGLQPGGQQGHHWKRQSE